MVAECHDPELAQSFIDYMLSVDAQRPLIDGTRWATVAEQVPPAIDPAVAALYPYNDLDDWLATSPIRGYPPASDPGDGTATYLDWVLAWDRVRAAKL
jgi:hypothetical protein